MKYFISLSFQKNCLKYDQIDLFRRRYDYKYLACPELLFTLLPPFRLQQANKEELLENITDCFDSHLHEIDEISTIEFKGIDFKAGKNKYLYLKPELSLDFLYCIESLKEELQYFDISFKKNVRQMTSQALLPIGRFSNNEDLDFVVNRAKESFTSAFTLEAKSISLYEKQFDIISEKCRLYDFQYDAKIKTVATNYGREYVV